MPMITVHWRHPLVATAGAVIWGMTNSRMGEITSSDSQGGRRCKADLVTRGEAYLGAAAIFELSDNVVETKDPANFDCAFEDNDQIEIWKATILFISFGRARYSLAHSPTRNLSRTFIRLGFGVDMSRFTLIVRNKRPW